jgi:hypothetical protein
MFAALSLSFCMMGDQLTAWAAEEKSADQVAGENQLIGSQQIS